jgi:hypothetical protein
LSKWWLLRKVSAAWSYLVNIDLPLPDPAENSSDYLFRALFYMSIKTGNTLG